MTSSNRIIGSRWVQAVAALSFAALVLVTLVGVSTDISRKVLIVGWVAFLAMAVSALLGARRSGKDAKGLVWGYGLSSGAMITSAAVFLVPPALNHHTHLGGFGIAFGIIAGFGAHTIGHRASHADFPFDYTVVSLTAHTVTAGLILGLVYTIPDISLVLGLAIVSHKAPAGYAAAQRLSNLGRPVALLAVPSVGVGVTAAISNFVGFSGSAEVNALVFGFASGIFLHVAMDFLPRCELGSDVYEVADLSGDAHEFLDKLRVHAVGSTIVGGIAVFAAWYLLV